MNTNQKMINEIVLGEISAINADGKQRYVGRLRSCNACVWETEHFYILQSYATMVAAIDKGNKVMFDFLRHVYGFTRTSSQHIAKFANDYGATIRYTFRP